MPSVHSSASTVAHKSLDRMKALEFHLCEDMHMFVQNCFVLPSPMLSHTVLKMLGVFMGGLIVWEPKSSLVQLLLVEDCRSASKHGLM